MESKNEAFAVWITGLPASGKSTIAVALRAQLADRGVDVALLESDVLRHIFASHRQYEAEGRDAFYRQMAYVGSLLVKHGVPVIFDATANRRIYRDRVRLEIPRFIEVYVDTSLETCMARDPKGIYRSAGTGQAANVPGLQDPYETPAAPEVVIHGENPESNALRIVERLLEERYLK